MEKFRDNFYPIFVFFQARNRRESWQEGNLYAAQKSHKQKKIFDHARAKTSRIHPGRGG